jgi:hypothetical protein
VTYASEVAADAPLLWYRLEGNTTNSGSLNDGGVTASGLTYATGAQGQAAVLNGSAQWFISTTNTYYNDKVFSLEAWFKVSPISDNTYYTLMRRSATNHVIMRVRGNVGAENGLMELYLGTSNVGFSLKSTGRVDDSAWHHAVYTIGPSNVVLYLDGVVNNSAATPIGTISLTAQQQFGREASNTERYVGSLDEVAIYGQELTAARVAAHFNPPPPFRGWGIPL